MAWTTSTPATRAAFTSRARLGIIVSRAASARTGRAASSPTTPFWTSDVTTAVRQDETSSARSTGMPGPYMTPRQGGAGMVPVRDVVTRLGAVRS